MRYNNGTTSSSSRCDGFGSSGIRISGQTITISINYSEKHEHNLLQLLTDGFLVLLQEVVEEEVGHEVLELGSRHGRVLVKVGHTLLPQDRVVNAEIS